jgi:hypothetical protein
MSTNPAAFCSGPGYVMNSGFQLSPSALSPSNGYCLIYLFQGAVLDTATKYACAVIGTVLLGVSLELLRFGRGELPARLTSGTVPSCFSFAPDSVALDVVMAATYGLQMVIAYALMLLVMTYESIMVLAIVLGLSIGHFLTLRWHRAKMAAKQAAGCNCYAAEPTDQFAPLMSSPCCGDNAVASMTAPETRSLRTSAPPALYPTAQFKSVSS